MIRAADQPRVSHASHEPAPAIAAPPEGRGARGHVLITGAGSAIARAVARRLAERGWSLIVAGRDARDMDAIASDLRVRYGVGAHPLVFDAMDPAAAAGLIDRSVAVSAGDLEGVIVAQGFMAAQGETDGDPELIVRTITVNYTASVAVVSAAAARFEARDRGFIGVISSVAGDRGRKSNFTYGSSKAAMNTYLDGLRHRLARTRVRVVTVKPGFVDTGMTWGLLKPGSPLVASPDRVARDVVRAIEKGRRVVYTPWFWRWIMLVIRAIPEPIFKRTSL